MEQEKLHKNDDLARNMDRVNLDVEALKSQTLPPNHDFNDTIKSIKKSITKTNR